MRACLESQPQERSLGIYMSHVAQSTHALVCCGRLHGCAPHKPCLCMLCTSYDITHGRALQCAALHMGRGGRDHNATRMLNMAVVVCCCAPGHVHESTYGSRSGPASREQAHHTSHSCVMRKCGFSLFSPVSEKSMPTFQNRPRSDIAESGHA